MSREGRLEALRGMLAEDPQDAFSRYALAMELKGQGLPAEALLEFGRLVGQSPDYVATYYQYGRLLSEQGQEEEALQVVRKGLEAAKQAGDDHTHGELTDLLDELSS